MSTFKRKRELFPRWEMPSDPVKALFWFLHWSLRVLTRFFWVLILPGVIYETIHNSSTGIGSGIVAGVVTLLVGLGVWAGIAVALVLFNLGSGVSQVVSDINRVQQGLTPRQQRVYRFKEPDADEKIVEGTVTDLEEERRKRRHE